MHFVSYEALFIFGLVFVVLVFVCNEVLEQRAVKKQDSVMAKQKDDE